jgi:hypothetical protein
MAAARRTLIVVLGETRAHELTFTLFKKNLMDRLDADLALCVGDNAREGRNPFYDHAKYVWKYKDPVDWADSYKEFAPGKNVYALLELPDQWFGGIHHPTLQQAGVGALLIVFREFLRRKLEAEGLYDKYDWFVLTRSDFIWPVMHPGLEFFSPEHLYLPDGERYRGYTDRHAMVPARFFRPFMDVARATFEEPEELAKRMKAVSPANWNTESFVKFRLGELGLASHVRFMPYMMYTVKPLGGPTGEGAPGGDNLQLNMYVKYPLEYSIARALQCVVFEPDDWKHMIGPTRLFNWRFWLFCWLRVLAEKHQYPGSFRTLRLLKRFLIYLAQPR